MRIAIRVEGMTCEHCVRAVRHEVESLEGVTAVDVDLETGVVEVASDSPIDEAALAGAVSNAGYEVKR